MTNFDFSDKIYNEARRCGYLALAETSPAEFEISLTGVWVLKHKNDLGVLKKLSDIVGKKIVEWSDLTERTLKKFKELILSTTCANSAKTTFAKLKAIIKDMSGEVDIPVTEKRASEILKCGSEPSQSVFLTEKEVAKLEGVEVKNEREQYVKCLFLLECYCSLRHIDILALSSDNIVSETDEEGNVTRCYISYVSQKTKTETHIPLHRNFNKYLHGYKKDAVNRNATFNDIVRRLCQRAGIKEHTKLFRRGEWQEGEKWQFISSHTGRKSMCSNLYLRGVDSTTIARMAGHSNSSITERTYIVPMRELNKKALDFFN